MHDCNSAKISAKVPVAFNGGKIRPLLSSDIIKLYRNTM